MDNYFKHGASTPCFFRIQGMKVNLNEVRSSILSPSDYQRISRRARQRADAGSPPRDALKGAGNGCDGNQSIRVSPTTVLEIYTALFYRQKSQLALAKEYGIAQSTISDIWRHESWRWLTAPLRYRLEQSLESAAIPTRSRGRRSASDFAY